MGYVLTFTGGIVFTLIVEAVLVYIYGRRAANKRKNKQ